MAVDGTALAILAQELAELFRLRNQRLRWVRRAGAVVRGGATVMIRVDGSSHLGRARWLGVLLSLGSWRWRRPPGWLGWCSCRWRLGLGGRRGRAWIGRNTWAA